MNWPEHIRKTVEHLAWIASMDREYAWWSANHWARLYPQFYGELPLLLTNEMRRRRGEKDTSR